MRPNFSQLHFENWIYLRMHDFNSQLVLRWQTRKILAGRHNIDFSISYSDTYGYYIKTEPVMCGGGVLSISSFWRPELGRRLPLYTKVLSSSCFSQRVATSGIVVCSFICVFGKARAVTGGSCSSDILVLIAKKTYLCYAFVVFLAVSGNKCVFKFQNDCWFSTILGLPVYRISSGGWLESLWSPWFH